MDLRFVNIPKIENDTILEDLAKDLLRADPAYENVNVNGRPGQGQDGIDVFARETASGNWIGVQCKVRSTNKPFAKKELQNEIDQAKNFNPKIAKYYLYTTLSRDSTTQAFERQLNDELRRSSSFSFEVLYWEDIESKLREPQFETVYHRRYRGFFKDNLALGHAIGKLVNLELGFDTKTDTHYELIIGKIPRYKDDRGTNVDYFRGTYYIVNLMKYKIEFFNKGDSSGRVSCFPSDINKAIENPIDSYRISKWLNSIEDIDGFIYNDEHVYRFFISSDERKEYDSSLGEDNDDE
jgi:hypothetical protein